MRFFANWLGLLIPQSHRYTKVFLLPVFSFPKSIFVQIKIPYQLFQSPLTNNKQTAWNLKLEISQKIQNSKPFPHVTLEKRERQSAVVLSDSALTTVENIVDGYLIQGLLEIQAVTEHLKVKDCNEIFGKRRNR